MDFNTYMASGLSYLVLEIDGSGSGEEGADALIAAQVAAASSTHAAVHTGIHPG